MSISFSCSKEKYSLICAWRNIIEHLSDQDRRICMRVCRDLRVMILHDPAANLEKMRERRAMWSIPSKALTESIGPSELFFNSRDRFPSGIYQSIMEDAN